MQRAGSSFKPAIFFPFNPFLALLPKNITFGRNTPDHIGKGRIKSIWFLRQSLPTAPSDYPARQARPPGRRGKRARIRAISPAWTQDCFWLTTGRRKMKWMKWDSCWPSSRKSETVVPKSLQRSVSTITFQIKSLHSMGGLWSRPYYDHCLVAAVYIPPDAI